MNEQSNTKLDIVNHMRKAYSEKNWELLKSFFADDVFYRPGAVKEMIGKQAIVDTFQQLYSIYTVDNMLPHRTWELEDVVIMEYDMRVTRISDNKSIKFPCVDIYQFKGDVISDWRVYPMHAKFAVSED